VPPGDLSTAPLGQAVAVAYDHSGQLIVQTRSPSALIIGARILELPGANTMDSGHQLFHMGTAGGLACASCHPEGREDGHVWKFANFGERRTQSIGGGLLGTEPFHWSGDMTNFAVLSHEVLTNRMSGPPLSDEHAAALAKWIDRIPAWKSAPAPDTAAAARGEALFRDGEVGCVACHAGEKLTNNVSVDVGTGSMFQVPSLRGIAYRAPYMHQGCAETLNDRFGACGGGDRHGKTSSLTTAQRADLVTFLGTL
jgi:mono/diheme cytochrome c family protein